MLGKDKLEKLLQQLRLVGNTEDEWVPAAEVERAMVKAGIRERGEQDQALLLLQVDPEAGRVFYARLRNEVSLLNQSPLQSIPNLIQQNDLVFKVIRELRELFNRFDIGSLSLSGLREGLTKLGLVETQSFLELCRHPYEMTFNQMVQCLTRTDQQPSVRPSTSHKSTTPSPAEQARPNSSETSVSENREANILRSHNGETSKIDLLTSCDHNPRRRSSSKGELLRSQIHAAIRLLDTGEIEEKAFLRRLADLQVDPPTSVHRLIEKYKLGSKVAFKDWVRAFEHLFACADREQTVDLSTSGLIFPTANKAETSETANRCRAPVRHPSQTRTTFFWEPADTELVNDKKSEKNAKKHWDAKPARSPIPSPMVIEPASQPASITGRGRPQESRRDGGRFLSWMTEEKPNIDTETIKPVRGLVGGQRDARSAPFAREGEAAEKQNLTGVRRSPEKRFGAGGRIPFGTEADYAASFANGVVPAFTKS